MNRTIHTIEAELKALHQDRTMSTSLWMEVYVQLQHELRAAHKADDLMDCFEEAMEDTYERLWSMSLHPWAWRGIALCSACFTLLV